MLTSNIEVSIKKGILPYTEGGYKWSYFVRDFIFKESERFFFVCDSGIDWFKYKIRNIIISNHIYLRKAMAVIHTFLLIKKLKCKMIRGFFVRGRVWKKGYNMGTTSYVDKLIYSYFDLDLLPPCYLQTRFHIGSNFSKQVTQYKNIFLTRQSKSYCNIIQCPLDFDRQKL